ncbi:putative membrane protein [Corynebacterium jeikeium]|nr:putative membrane protein [Corynebacterium jeikeium]
MVKAPTFKRSATTRGDQAPTSANSVETAADGPVSAERAGGSSQNASTLRADGESRNLDGGSQNSSVKRTEMSVGSNGTNKRPRILGLDIARGLAIVGMIYLHLGHPLWQTKVILSGLPAALFAVIAGVTMMLIWINATARATTTQTIAKLAARGALITLIGLVLLPAGGEIQVVLVVLGATMLATAWVPPLPTAAKVALLLIATAAATWRYAPLELPLPYPHLAWVAYILAGMILFDVYVGKDGTGAGGVIKITTAIACVAAAIGFYLRFQTDLPGWARATGHTGVLGEIVLSIAVAAIVLHLSLIVGRRVRAANPLVALGSMALTVYILHVLSALWWQTHVSLHSDMWAAAFIAAFLAFAWAWKKLAAGPARKLFAGQGPAERCVAQVVRLITGERGARA